MHGITIASQTRSHLASFPGHFLRGRKKRPGIICSRMHEIPRKSWELGYACIFSVYLIVVFRYIPGYVQRMMAEYSALRGGMLTTLTCSLCSIFPHLELMHNNYIINELVDFSPSFFIPKPPTNLRSSRSTSLFIQPLARTNSLKYSFAPLTCSVWNTLPNHVTDAQSLMAFKKLLYRCILSPNNT